MRSIFEEVHQAVVEGAKQSDGRKSLIEVPGLSDVPLRVQYQEFANIVAGEVFNDDNTLAGTFLGYPCGGKAFQVIAVKSATKAFQASGVDAPAHLDAFAKRLQLDGYTFNREYAI